MKLDLRALFSAVVLTMALAQVGADQTSWAAGPRPVPPQAANLNNGVIPEGRTRPRTNPSPEGGTIDSTAPRCTLVLPSAGGWVTRPGGLSEIVLTFNEAIAAPVTPGAVTVWMSNAPNIAGPQTLGTTVQQGTTPNELRVTLPSAVSNGVVTLVADHRVTDSALIPLDGELSSPQGALLPSGDGRRGGPLVLQFRVLVGDVNRDGFVDGNDLGIIISNYNLVGAPGDLDGDGVVDADDLSAVLTFYMASLAPDDGARPSVTATTPSAEAPLENPVPQIVLNFSEPVVQARLAASSAFLVNESGTTLLVPTGVALSGDGREALFTLPSAAPPCETYLLGISPAIADPSGALLSPPAPVVKVTGLTPPEAPTVDPTPPVTATEFFTFTGLAPRSQSVEIVFPGPVGAITVPVTNGQFGTQIQLQPDMLSSVFFTGISQCGVRSAPTSRRITRDATPPAVFIDYPPAGAALTSDTVTVLGRVGDEFSGFSGISVTVNGLPAQVTQGSGNNGTFSLANVPVNPTGPTVITAIATDALGNVSPVGTLNSVTVTRLVPQANAFTMTAVGGEAQTARVRTSLANPLAVLVKKPDGSPLPGKLVTFDVTRSDGRLFADSSYTGDGSVRLQVFTNTQGLATAFWRLGSDTGIGNNRVSVTSQDIVGSIFFSASATPAPASRIVVSDHNNQRAQAGAQLAQPLRVFVTDGDTGNGVPNVPVLFTIASGNGGAFDEQSAARSSRSLPSESIVIPTDASGRADAYFTLGQAPGEYLVEATFDGNPGLPAVFQATALQRNDNQPTTVEGLLLDNAGRAIGGAVMTLKTTVQFNTGPASFTLGPKNTDVNGRFTFTAADLPPGALDTDLPAGPAKLLADARNPVTLAGQPKPVWSFPYVGYEMVLVKGAVNTLPTPIYLPELDPANEVVYDGTQDVVLKVKGIEGLEFKVKAGSMTRENLSRPSPSDPEVLRLNQVHFDEVPMPLPDGTAFPFAWTLQPKNARFDPPVEVTLPNLAGLPPGSTTSIVQWNNDTANFQAMGTGRVSADGSVIRTDPGTGITVAGWGGVTPPPPPTGDLCKGSDVPGCGADCSTNAQGQPCCTKPCPRYSLRTAGSCNCVSLLCDRYADSLLPSALLARLELYDELDRIGRGAADALGLPFFAGDAFPALMGSELYFNVFPRWLQYANEYGQTFANPVEGEIRRNALLHIAGQAMLTKVFSRRLADVSGWSHEWDYRDDVAGDVPSVMNRETDVLIDRYHNYLGQTNSFIASLPTPTLSGDRNFFQIIAASLDDPEKFPNPPVLGLDGNGQLRAADANRIAGLAHLLATECADPPRPAGSPGNPQALRSNESLRMDPPRLVLSAPGESVQFRLYYTSATGEELEVTQQTQGIYLISGFSEQVARLGSLPGSVTGVRSGWTRATIQFVDVAANRFALCEVRISVGAVSDADGDGVSDHLEVGAGMDPSDPTDAASDEDFDHVVAADEVSRLGTSPSQGDSDMDGRDDGEEARTLLTDPATPNPFLLPGFTVEVDGRTTTVREDGSFRLRGIRADQGLKRVKIRGSLYGQPRFGRSDPTPIVANGTVSVNTFVVQSTPVLDLVALTMDTTNSLLTPGDTATVTVNAFYSNGSSQDVTNPLNGTVLFSTNPEICSVSPTGTIAAVSNGVCFIIATNDGSSVVRRFEVVSSVVQTTVSGVAVGSTGGPAGGAKVSLLGTGLITTAAPDGSFAFPTVSVPFDALLSVSVELGDACSVEGGSSVPTIAQSGGVTDVGVVTLQPMAVPAPGQWAMFRGDSARSGFVQGVSNGPATQLVWRRSGIGSVTTSGISLGIDGSVYYRSNDAGRVFRLDGATGEVVAQSAVFGGTDGGVTIHNGAAWTVQGNQLIELDPSTLATRRVITYPAFQDLKDAPLTSILPNSPLGNHTFYLCDAARRAIHAADSCTGDLLWSTPDNTLKSQFLGKLGPAWVDAQGRSCVANFGNTATQPGVAVADNGDGTFQVLWNNGGPGNFNWWGSGAMNAIQTKIYVTTFSDGNRAVLWALSPITGQTIWSLPNAGRRNSFGRPVVAGSRIYIGNHNGVLTAINDLGNSQSVAWEFNSFGQLSEFTALSAFKDLSTNLTYIYTVEQRSPSSSFLILRDNGTSFTEILRTNLQGTLRPNSFGNSSCTVDTRGCVYIGSGVGAGAVSGEIYKFCPPTTSGTFVPPAVELTRSPEVNPSTPLQARSTDTKRRHSGTGVGETLGGFDPGVTDAIELDGSVGVHSASRLPSGSSVAQEDSTGAVAVNSTSDGKLVVGWANDADGWRAPFIWKREIGMRPLKDLTDPRDYHLLPTGSCEAVAIDADGRVTIRISQPGVECAPAVVVRTRLTPATRADIDADGVVSTSDLRTVISQLGQDCLACDLDLDGRVDVRDLVELVMRFGEGVSEPQ